MNMISKLTNSKWRLIVSLCILFFYIIQTNSYVDIFLCFCLCLIAYFEFEDYKIRINILDLIITLIFLSFELVNLCIYPIYRIKTCYLQLEYSAVKTTTNKIVSSVLRMIMSLMKIPFCTGIGQVCSSIYQFISINIMFYRKYKINTNGTISKKGKTV